MAVADHLPHTRPTDLWRLRQGRDGLARQKSMGLVRFVPLAGLVAFLMWFMNGPGTQRSWLDIGVEAFLDGIRWYRRLIEHLPG